MTGAGEAAFVPRFLDGSLHVPEHGDAYIHVHLTEMPQPAEPITVYLSDGTALVVCGRDLLRLAPAHDASEVTA